MALATPGGGGDARRTPFLTPMVLGGCALLGQGGSLSGLGRNDSGQEIYLGGCVYVTILPRWLL